IVAIAAALTLGAFAARAASQSSSVQHTSWGQLKGRYRSGRDQSKPTDARVAADRKARVASLASVTLTPASVVGGNASQGTGGLTAGAPVGGAVVTLSSSNPGLASPPASVSIPAGSKTATFSVTTTVPAADGSAIITATYNAVVRTATLTVTRLPAPPPPP